MHLCLDQFRNVSWLRGDEPVEVVARGVGGTADDVVRGLPTNRPRKMRTIQPDEVQRHNPSATRDRP